MSMRDLINEFEACGCAFTDATSAAMKAIQGRDRRAQAAMISGIDFVYDHNRKGELIPVPVNPDHEKLLKRLIAPKSKPKKKGGRSSKSVGSKRSATDRINDSPPRKRDRKLDVSLILNSPIKSRTPGTEINSETNVEGSSRGPTSIAETVADNTPIANRFASSPEIPLADMYEESASLVQPQPRHIDKVTNDPLRNLKLLAEVASQAEYLPMTEEQYAEYSRGRNTKARIPVTRSDVDSYLNATSTFPGQSYTRPQIQYPESSVRFEPNIHILKQMLPDKSEGDIEKMLEEDPEVVWAAMALVEMKHDGRRGRT